MKKTPREYQQSACKAIVAKWREDSFSRPYASVMTGLGKSLCFAMLANRLVNRGERVLMLVPRKELVEQNFNEAFNYFDNQSALGIVCAQMDKKQHHKQCVIAMASSFVNLRTVSGSFDYLLIDECHHISYRKEGNKGIYAKIIDSLTRINPSIRVAGMTGTPYRLDQGELHEESLKIAPFFTHKVYDTSIEPGVKSLIEQGYLSHIETLNSSVNVDLSGVKISGNDFNTEQAGIKFDAIIEDAVSDMRKLFDKNNIDTALIFVSTLANARHVLSSWGDGSTMRIVCADESICTKAQRRSALEWAKHGDGKRYIVNVDILAEGYDHRALQCCVLLRATKSPGLMVQMVGRVIRPHEDKSHAFLIDYGTNIERLGAIDNIIPPSPSKKRAETPKKLCLIPTCNEANLLSAKRCIKCGAEFISINEEGNYSMRTQAQALEAKRAKGITEHFIDSIEWVECFSKKAGVPMIKGLMYELDYNGMPELVHEYYLCIEHEGKAGGDIARHKLKAFFKDQKDYYLLGKAHINVKNMVMLLNDNPGFFKQIGKITLAPKEKGCRELLIMEFRK